jgi:hypothetical protein
MTVKISIIIITTIIFVLQWLSSPDLKPVLTAILELFLTSLGKLALGKMGLIFFIFYKE